MTNQLYRTASGKSLDMGELALRNETVRAVGNLKVNARGDLLDDNGNVISSKNAQTAHEYNNQVQTPQQGTK